MQSWEKRGDQRGLGFIDIPSILMHGITGQSLGSGTTLLCASAMIEMERKLQQRCIPGLEKDEKRDILKLAKIVEIFGKKTMADVGFPSDRPSPNEARKFLSEFFEVLLNPEKYSWMPGDGEIPSVALICNDIFNSNAEPLNITEEVQKRTLYRTVSCSANSRTFKLSANQEYFDRDTNYSSHYVESQALNGAIHSGEPFRAHTESRGFRGYRSSVVLEVEGFGKFGGGNVLEVAFSLACRYAYGSQEADRAFQRLSATSTIEGCSTEREYLRAFDEKLLGYRDASRLVVESPSFPRGLVFCTMRDLNILRSAKRGGDIAQLLPNLREIFTSIGISTDFLDEFTKACQS